MLLDMTEIDFFCETIRVVQRKSQKERPAFYPGKHPVADPFEEVQPVPLA